MSLTSLTKILSEEFIHCFENEMAGENEITSQFKGKIKAMADLYDLSNKDTYSFLNTKRLLTIYDEVGSQPTVDAAIEKLIKNRRLLSQEKFQPTVYYKYTCVINEYLKNTLERIEQSNEFTLSQKMKIQNHFKKMSSEKNEAANVSFGSLHYSKNHIRFEPISPFWDKNNFLNKEVKIIKDISDLDLKNMEEGVLYTFSKP